VLLLALTKQADGGDHVVFLALEAALLLHEQGDPLKILGFGVIFLLVHRSIVANHHYDHLVTAKRVHFGEGIHLRIWRGILEYRLGASLNLCHKGFQASSLWAASLAAPDKIPSVWGSNL
jgi:hypothetical protein